MNDDITQMDIHAWYKASREIDKRPVSVDDIVNAMGMLFPVMIAGRIVADIVNQKEKYHIGLVDEIEGRLKGQSTVKISKPKNLKVLK